MTIFATEDRYSRAAEAVWKLLLAHQHEAVTDGIERSWPLMDHFAKKNPWLMPEIRRLQDEIRYELSEAQCSWAVLNFLGPWDEAEGWPPGITNPDAAWGAYQQMHFGTERKSA